jgi:CRISPR-associated endonuclease/helicase Cas3
VDLRIEYHLKSHPPDRLLKDHLRRVALAAQKTVQELLNSKVTTSIPHNDLVKTAIVVAACHDLGKGTPYFQSYLLGEKVDVYLKSHSMIGALYASWLILNDETISEKNRSFLARAAALAIQGHHGSLKSSPKCLENVIYFYKNEIFSRQIESFKINEQELESIMTRDFKLKSFIEFCNNWKSHYHHVRRELFIDNPDFENKIEPFFMINLLFSALIDNDNLDAAELDRPARLPIDQNVIKNYIGRNLKETKEIDILRNQLFRYVDNQPVDLNNRVYSLTAATGLGKTLTSMNFALNLREKIIKEKGYRPRIIYVAPFISILDQNFETLQNIFDQKRTNTNLLLIHHHLANVTYHDNIKDEDYATFQSEFLSHGWNGEIIVTTFIQFFNMVFGRFTSQLRRLDNVIGSIVILDEVQSIPFHLLDIVRKGLLFLANKFNFTIILMTATQPLIFKKGETKEIADESIKLPNRVSFVLRNDEKISLEDFCTEMHKIISEHKDKNIMIELNTLKTARAVYDSLKNDIITHEIRFLSSQVIPRHRRPRIHEIKNSLADANKKTVLVTTQVVEAGVDLDFDIAIRDIGPVDSIIQAAGRCNREGKKKTEDSLFYIYRIMDVNEREHATYIYGNIAIDIANKLLRTKDLDIENLVKKYNEIARTRLSMEKSNEIYRYVAELDYENAEKEFLILDEGHYKLPVFIEFDQEATEIWEKYIALSKVDDNQKKTRRTAESVKLRNEMGQYMIDINMTEVYTIKLHDIGGIYRIKNEDIHEYYDKEKGFVFVSE